MQISQAFNLWLFFIFKESKYKYLVQCVALKVNFFHCNYIFTLMLESDI